MAVFLPIPLRDDTFVRNDQQSLKSGINRRDLKQILSDSTITINHKKCCVVFGSFTKELIQNASNEMLGLNFRNLIDFIEPLRNSLFTNQIIIYFTGASELKGKPTYFRDAINSIGCKLADIDNTAIVTADMNAVRRLAFEWFVDSKYDNTNQQINGLMALNPFNSLPTSVIPDLCDVCVVFVEKDSDCNEIERFIRKGKLVIPVLLNRIPNLVRLQSVFIEMEDFFDFKSNDFQLKSNNYESIAEIVAHVVSSYKLQH